MNKPSYPATVKAIPSEKVIVTLIPTKKLNEVHARSKHGALLKLQNLLEFRDTLPLQEYKAQGLLTQAETEWAGAMMVTIDSLRRSLWTLQDYSGGQLATWITNGVSFHHIERANSIAEKAKITPVQLLDDAYQKGNEYGKTMTVEQMTLYALGGRKQPEVVYSIGRIFDAVVKLSHRLGWDKQKLSEFEGELIEFKKRWFG